MRRLNGFHSLLSPNCCYFIAFLSENLLLSIWIGSLVGVKAFFVGLVRQFTSVSSIKTILLPSFNKSTINSDSQELFLQLFLGSLLSGNLVIASFCLVMPCFF